MVDRDELEDLLAELKPYGTTLEQASALLHRLGWRCKDPDKAHPVWKKGAFPLTLARPKKRYFFPKYVSLIKREVRAEFESRGEDDSEN